MNEERDPRRTPKILVIDDSPDIRRAYQRVLCPKRPRCALSSLDAEVFGVSTEQPAATFDTHFASQGQEGCELAHRELLRGVPFDAAFVDMKMPPGWDGVETTANLFELQPDLRVAICSGYLDFSWHALIARVERPDVRYLRKPFSGGELMAMAWALVRLTYSPENCSRQPGRGDPSTARRRRPHGAGRAG